MLRPAVIGALSLLVLAGCEGERLARGAASESPAVAPASAAPSPAAEPPGAAAPRERRDSCGRSGMPDCPLQAWMKATLQSYLLAGERANTERLRAALEKLATVAPAGYPEWATMAREGAEHAAAKRLAGVRRSCVACHDAYRTRYKAEMRERKLL